MTDEELDRARINEARRLYGEQSVPIPNNSPIQIAVRLAREGWKPEDPLLKEAREMWVRHLQFSGSAAENIRAGKNDHTDPVQNILRGLRRGVEIGRAERGRAD